MVNLLICKHVKGQGLRIVYVCLNKVLQTAVMALLDTFDIPGLRVLLPSEIYDETDQNKLTIVLIDEWYAQLRMCHLEFDAKNEYLRGLLSVGMDKYVRGIFSTGHKSKKCQNWCNKYFD